MHYNRSVDISTLPIIPVEAPAQVSQGGPEVSTEGGLLAWLRAVAGKMGEEAPESTKSSTMETMGVQKGEKLTERTSQGSLPQNFQSLLSTSIPGQKLPKAPAGDPGYSPSGGMPKVTRLEDVNLPTTQAPSQVANPPIYAKDASPVDRSADDLGRRSSSPVNRSVDNRIRAQVKRTSLVNPEHRMWVKRNPDKSKVRRYDPTLKAYV